MDTTSTGVGVVVSSCIVRFFLFHFFSHTCTATQKRPTSRSPSLRTSNLSPLLLFLLLLLLLVCTIVWSYIVVSRRYCYIGNVSRPGFWHLNCIQLRRTERQLYTNQVHRDSFCLRIDTSFGIFEIEPILSFIKSYILFIHKLSIVRYKSFSIRLLLGRTGGRFNVYVIDAGRRVYNEHLLFNMFLLNFYITGHVEEGSVMGNDTYEISGGGNSWLPLIQNGRVNVHPAARLHRSSRSDE